MARMAGSGGGFNKPFGVRSSGLGNNLSPHLGLSRNAGGGFIGAGAASHMPVGGSSDHGDDMIQKYKPSVATPVSPLGAAPPPGSAVPVKSNG